jgi:glucose-6-phosphate isomerase
MSRLTQSPAWNALAAHRAALSGVHMRALFEADPRRNERYWLHAAGITLDYSKNVLTDATMPLLHALARQQDVPGWVEQMFAGSRINNTEGRAAFHVALRATEPMLLDGQDVLPAVRRVRAAMRAFVDAVRSGLPV